MSTLIHSEYNSWFSDLKSKIKHRQIKAAVAVNSELIMMYWELGREILKKSEKSVWGSGFINQLSADLKTEFSEMTGFSADNLRQMKNFYSFYSSSIISEQAVPKFKNAENEIGIKLEQVVPKSIENLFSIPWGHHILILKKIKKPTVAFFFINQIIENNWSRSVLEYQIETELYERQGKAVTNFNNTLPTPNSDLASALLKDPYNFDFLSLSQKVQERELETKLVEHISQFLLELGKGFAYMGKQFPVKIGNKEYRTDLLFYHTKLRCYIVIELKTIEFEPEFVGKLNFYISAINELIKSDEDNPTIGILLCKNKDNYEVEFALKDINKPIGVSEYNYKQLPERIKKSLPTEEQFEYELKKIAKK